MNKTQRCAASGCTRTDATYEMPLCHEHWVEWERGHLEECEQCHWIAAPFSLNLPSNYYMRFLGKRDAVLCPPCAYLTMAKRKQIESYCSMQTAEYQRISAMFEGRRLSSKELEDARRQLSAFTSQALKKLQSKPMPEPPSKIPLTRLKNYVYVLKNLSDGSYYVGQTNDLKLRYQEHRDGRQARTKDKNPKLVYFEEYIGEREEVTERENELTLLNQSPAGQRQLRKLIEEFREPLRLLDLDA